jgi:hypothetical protein
MEDVYSRSLCGEEYMCVLLSGYSCQHCRSNTCASVNDARTIVEIREIEEVYIIYI